MQQTRFTHRFVTRKPAAERAFTRGLLALLLPVAAILAITMPWTGFQDHAHWDRVQWAPFASRSDNLRDIVLNVLLFVPLGASLASLSSRIRLWHVLLAAVILSAGVELAQVFSHGRIPSLTDVVCNVTGTGLGYSLAVVAGFQRAR